MSVLSGHAAAFKALSSAFQECSNESVARGLSDNSFDTLPAANQRAMLMADFGQVFGRAAAKLKTLMAEQTTGTDTREAKR